MLIYMTLQIKFAAGQLLLIDRLQHLTPSFYRRLGKGLTLPQLYKDLGFFKLLLVLLKSLVYVFAVFGIDD